MVAISIGNPRPTNTSTGQRLLLRFFTICSLKSPGTSASSSGVRGASASRPYRPSAREGLAHGGARLGKKRVPRTVLRFVAAETSGRHTLPARPPLVTELLRTKRWVATGEQCSLRSERRAGGLSSPVPASPRLSVPVRPQTSEGNTEGTSVRGTHVHARLLLFGRFLPLAGSSCPRLPGRTHASRLVARW